MKQLDCGHCHKYFIGDSKFCSSYCNFRDRFKKVFYLYQRSMWYLGFTAQETQKPLRFLNETLLIITYLAVLDIRPGVVTIIITYLIVITSAVVLGKLLVFFGVIRYNTTLANGQNMELMEILKKIEQIERKLNK